MNGPGQNMLNPPALHPNLRTHATCGAKARFVFSVFVFVWPGQITPPASTSLGARIRRRTLAVASSSELWAP